MLLSEAIEALCIATRADGRSPATVAAYREKLSYLADHLGCDTPVESITVHDLRAYIADLWDRDLSEFTVAGRVRALKRLFNWLLGEGIISENPAHRIKTPKPKRGKPKGISLESVTALLATTEPGSVIDLRDRAIICLLYDSGCRVAGLCGLRIGDLDLANRRAVVREKRGKSRYVMFLPGTAEALKDWLDVRPDIGEDWLFIGLGSSSRGKLGTRGVGHMLRRRAKQAGIAGPVNPHSFRHAFAREFLLSGGDLGTLSDLMGHESVAITKEWYGIFTVGELQRKHDQHSPAARLFGGDDKNGDSW
jgi:integrase/recombinase XerC